MTSFDSENTNMLNSGKPPAPWSAPANGITVELSGGLGNQLFMYAAGLEQANRLQCPLFLDTTWYQGRVNRTFALPAFNFRGETTSSNRFLRRGSDYCRKLLFLQSKKSGNIICEHGFEYDSSVNNAAIGSRLRGYFQSWKYFPTVQEELRNQINSLINPSIWFENTLRELQANGEWVAIHVRRGDYLNRKTKAFHGLLEHDYYQQAISLVDSMHGKLPIVIFSDDLLLSKEMFSRESRSIRYIAPPHDSSDLESILLMAQSSAIITANSSFSWWGAWIGQSEQRTVVVPKTWIKHEGTTTEDLFLDTWLVVP